MTRWTHPSQIPQRDWTAAPFIVRADGGSYGMPARVIIAREGPYGLTIYHTIPAESYDQARAIASATSAYCAQVRRSDPREIEPTP